MTTDGIVKRLRTRSTPNIRDLFLIFANASFLFSYILQGIALVETRNVPHRSIATFNNIQMFYNTRLRRQYEDKLVSKKVTVAKPSSITAPAPGAAKKLIPAGLPVAQPELKGLQGAQPEPKATAYDGYEAHRYYYPPRMALPLPTCFYNPTGYACCNPALNDLIVETYSTLEAKPKFSTCNINVIATTLQRNAQTRFNTSFETVAAFDDFAEKIHFRGDLVCKVSVGGKYMLAYATVNQAHTKLNPNEEEELLNGNSGHATENNAHNFALANKGEKYHDESGLGKRVRQKRAETLEEPAEKFIGPQLELPLNHLSRKYQMWI